MDLGVTMGISLRFKAAQPYFWRKKKEEEFGRQWRHKKRPGPGEMRFPLASVRQAAGGGREGPALGFGFCPLACSLTGPLQQPRRKTRHPGRHRPRGAYAAVCQHFRGHTEAPAEAAEAPSRRAGLPSSPLGPWRVLSLTSGECVAARACVSVLGGGGPPSCSIRPFY